MARVLAATKVLPDVVTKKADDNWVDLGVVAITPETAEQWLKNLPADNIKRMTDRREDARVGRYARAMIRLEWQTNPSSRILLGKDGVLLDGKGRLTAVLISGVTIYTYVSQSDTRTDATGLAVDQAVPRSASYVLQQPGRLVKTAGFAFSLLKNRPPDHGELVPFCGEFIDIYERLGMESRRGLGTSTSLQLAAIMTVVSRKASDRYIADILTLFSRRNPRDLPPLAYSFYRQLTSERLNHREQLVRAFRAFDERSQGLKKLQLRDPTIPLEEIRHLLRVSVKEWR